MSEETPPEGPRGRIHDRRGRSRFGDAPGRDDVVDRRADDDRRDSDDRRTPADRRSGERRQAQLPAGEVSGWDGVERRTGEDRRAYRERRENERRDRDRRAEETIIDSYWPMDDEMRTAHDRRQDERRGRERRQAQLDPSQVPGWDGTERRVGEDRRALERREFERRLRANSRADGDGTLKGTESSRRRKPE